MLKEAAEKLKKVIEEKSKYLSVKTLQPLEIFIKHEGTESTYTSGGTRLPKKSTFFDRYGRSFTTARYANVA
jgi:hypothetical protein